MQELKQCSACKQLKPTTEFHNNCHGKGGLYSKCKPCTRETNRQWRLRNPERVRETNRAQKRRWYWKNREKKLALDKTYRLKNREKYLERGRRYYANNKNTHRESILRRLYGIGVRDYDEMFEKQGRRCAVCEVTVPGGPGRRFAIDHSHTTGRVRGLLCYMCNTGLGKFKDDSSLLRRAAAYLESSGEFLGTEAQSANKETVHEACPALRH